MPLNTQVLRDLGPYVGDDEMEKREMSLVRAIKLLLDADDVDGRHRRQLIDIALWKFTEASGMSPHAKYNLRYVTDGARDLDTPARLNHEHVWPRKRILDELLDGRSWDLEALESFLRAHAVACVVTVEEHAALSIASGSGWGRYVSAGVMVWDRQEKCFLNRPTGEPVGEDRIVAAASASTATTFDLHQVIDEKAPGKATLLRRLTRMARFANAVSVVSVKQTGEVSDYFRIHDALIGEPTRAVAYPHWSGKVDFALSPQDVPEDIMAAESVHELSEKVYRITCKVTDESSLEVAEELLFLALEKLRAAHDDD